MSTYYSYYSPLTTLIFDSNYTYFKWVEVKKISSRSVSTYVKYAVMKPKPAHSAASLIKTNG